MDIHILYFAALRENLGAAEEHLALPPDGLSLGQLRQHLAARGGDWQALTAMRNLKAAVNQAMAGPDVKLKAGDEVAFFPPVTGG